jgi:cob(I)alamin adenosyltransferase
MEGIRRATGSLEPIEAGSKQFGGFMERGYVHVYTGDGKGKTTASLGLVMRAVGAGLAVHVVQFIKSMEYHELRTLGRLKVPVRQFGRGCFIEEEPAAEDKKLAEKGLEFVRALFRRDDLDLLVLDEINIAHQLGLLDLEDVLEIVRSKPVGLEMVCTGRGAPRELIDAADLVTEMVNVKHYYDAGILARDGIER